ncbi:flagellar basal body-associated FliL family protein [Marivita hallyeonensis]|uniref:Flagellar protein FliL n=1 Tax=Marivita hallyeonensis TaxID=996342 RepID=A0A1M5XTZ0_9RHOB|nr:flagellar basal body-associated FliL family protein [Marivita hallyeonensis]SHI03267.1 flagellar FliL protein [Marivita hallyeonensis]
MTAAADTEPEDAPSKSKMPFILSAVLLIAGLGLGYFGMSSGLLPMTDHATEEETAPVKASDLPDVVFVTIPTIMVTMPPGAHHEHLRFSAQVEVKSQYQEDVEFLMPRIQDLMNGYLRALKAEDIEGVGAIFEIRLQLFRRIIMVVGQGKVNGLLVTEFLLK